MKIFAETDRLILREITLNDDQGMFELDSDPEVHWYLGKNPIHSIDDSRKIIESLQQQYADNGIGRWAVIEKSTGNFTGWAGLKLMQETVNGYTNFHDLGYRLIRKYWGHGYATEAAIAARNYGFEEMKLDAIYGMTSADNLGSQNVLQKAGLKYVNDFDRFGIPHKWYNVQSQK